MGDVWCEWYETLISASFHLEEEKHVKRNQTKTEGEIHLFLMKALFVCKHYPGNSLN